MINAALKVFAKNGYYRACTDEIVKEAEISKGLLFHYFVSKAGLYDFICDYSIRYMKLELSGMVNQGNDNFWKHCKEIEAVKIKIMGNYPYMPLFLDTACEETAETIGEELMQKLSEYRVFLSQVYGTAQDHAIYGKLSGYLSQGAMKHYLMSGENDPDRYYMEVSELLDTLFEMSAKI